MGDYLLSPCTTTKSKRDGGRRATRPRGRFGEEMSERSQVTPMPEGEYFETSRFSGLSLLLGVLALVGLICCGLGAFIDPRQFAFSWMFAFAFFFTLCAGCFFWIIVHYATDAEWSVVVRRQLENISLLFPVLAILFLPALFL